MLEFPGGLSGYRSSLVTAVVQVQFLAWEFTNAVGVPKKKKKIKNVNLIPSFESFLGSKELTNERPGTEKVFLNFSYFSIFCSWKIVSIDILKSLSNCFSFILKSPSGK